MSRRVEVDKLLALIEERADRYRESGSRGTLGNCDTAVARELRDLLAAVVKLAVTEPAERTWDDAWANEKELLQKLPWGSRWRHKKRGTTYSTEGVALFQDATGSGEHDMTLVVIYRSDERKALCVRRVEEFLDGRFERIDR